MQFTRLNPCALVLALAVMIPSLAGGQATSTVRGRTVDSRTGNPIPSAQVSVEGTGLGASTDAQGVFTIAGVPDGSRTLIARRIGYAPQRKQVTVSAGMTDVTFSLEVTANTLEQVVVTGTATPTTVRALGTSIASVDNSQIAEARSVTVDQALQGKIAGAQITQNSGSPGGDWRKLSTFSRRQSLRPKRPPARW